MKKNNPADIGPSAYAKLQGWKSLRECSEFTGVSITTLTRYWNGDNAKARALIGSSLKAKIESEMGGANDAEHRSNLHDS